MKLPKLRGWIILFLLRCNIIYSQQDPIFSQYMFNGLNINPAVAGSSDNINSSLIYKSMGTIHGAPVVEAFTIDAPIKYKQMGLGLQANTISFGIQNRFSVSGCYAYKINFSKGILSFGISGGLLQSSIDYSHLVVKYDYEKSFLPNNTNILPDAGAGLYYQNKQFYVGFSALHLIPNSIDNSNANGYFQLGNRSFYLTGAYKWELSDKVQVLPSLILRYASLPYLQGDFTTHVKYDDMVWAGFSWRTNNVLSLQAGFKITDFLKISRQNIKIGYAYDYYNFVPGTGYGSSHELMLIMNFGIYEQPSKIRKGKINISPVFF